tara:strand:- start:143 stop:283 length:141 start_codon:yes stop_codon:yes gene_type:complete
VTGILIIDNHLAIVFLQGLRAVEFKHQASARNDPFGLDTILTGAWH